jgi:hypothetical protein
MTITQMKLMPNSNKENARRNLMAKHDIFFNVPQRRLGKTDIDFIVKIDGELFGELAISNGSVVWYPKGTQQGFKMGKIALQRKTRNKKRSMIMMIPPPWGKYRDNSMSHISLTVL